MADFHSSFSKYPMNSTGAYILSTMAAVAFVGAALIISPLLILQQRLKIQHDTAPKDGEFESID